MRERKRERESGKEIWEQRREKEKVREENILDTIWGKSFVILYEYLSLLTLLTAGVVYIYCIMVQTTATM